VPQLIFLNACESARVRGGEAPLPDDSDQAHIGLAEGFLRAGARTLIGNFWKVQDSSARDLAKVVYEKLSQGAPIGEAILSGRKLLFDANDPSWANYILYGDAEMHW
jgi:CHAT domain-containing protein